MALNPATTFPPVQHVTPRPMVIVDSVPGAAYSGSASVTRPADTTAYAAGDVIGTAVTSVLNFSAAGPTFGGNLVLTNVTLEIDVAAIPSGMTTFRLHLYNAAPTAIADNVAYDLAAGDRTKYLGFVDLPTPLDFGSTLWSETESQIYWSIRKQITLVDNNLYGVLQTVAGYTPTSAAVFVVGVKLIGS